MRGMIYVTAAPGSARHLTSDILWGILNYIYDCMDYYGEGDWSAAKIKARVRKVAARYRAQTWEPMGGSDGIPIYETDPDRCRLGPVVDHRGARMQGGIDRDIDAFVAAKMERMRESELRFTSDSDVRLREEVRQENAERRAFINSHAFPSEAAVLRFIAESAAMDGDSIYATLPGVRYRHDAAKQLYGAGAVESEEEKMRRIRRLGHSLNGFGGFDAMSLHFYVVHHVLFGQHFFQTEDSANGRSGYYYEIQDLWDGVGTWRP
eukprot:GEMP01045899.1.p1 GENE.GEMP01045899.1~~GEMP01045899.1.p1  ORF type:complete len:264 (+),score=68.64 GEMP01045899.1:483-1274(+)